MTTLHTQTLENARRYANDPANNPWSTGCGQIATVTERLKHIRNLSVEQLLACLNWPGTEMSVKCAIETRLRVMRKTRGNDQALRPEGQ